MLDAVKKKQIHNLGYPGFRGSVPAHFGTVVARILARAGECWYLARNRAFVIESSSSSWKMKIKS